jgi:7-cyano-7-deazaguanine synthase
MLTNRGDALVLFSGGQDSTTCLFWSLMHPSFEHVHAVSFDYDQRHKVELEQAVLILREIAQRFGRGVSHTILRIPALAELGGAALTDAGVEVELEASARGGNAYAAARGLPSTFVPGRNTILIGTAAALAGRLGAPHLVTGICAMDRAGYPDCRAEYASSLEATLRIGLDWPQLTLHTPILHASKADTWRIAHDAAGAGAVELIRDLSHTCYHGDRTMREYGAGCGECPACLTRAEGWNEYTAEAMV